jgi:ribosomal protein L40E
VFLPFPQCLFCNHVNPTGAKFCNDCGSPLHLKLCSRCEAVNDQAAKSCYKCRTEFPVLSTTSEAPPMASAPDTMAPSAALNDAISRFEPDEPPKPAPSAAKVTAAAKPSGARKRARATAGSPAPQLARPVAAIELDKLDLAFDPQRSTFEDPTPSVLVGSVRGHTPELASAADIQDVPRRCPNNETARTHESEAEIVTREPRSLGRDVASLSCAAQRATMMAPLHNLEATAELRPMSRVALAGLVPTVALIVIGISAYYVYSHSLQLRDSQGAQAVSAASADVNSGDPPTRPIPKIGVTASSVPSATVGTGSDAAIGAAKTASLVEPSTAVTTAPVSQGTAAATGSNGGASQTPSPNPPPPQVSTSDQVTPAQPFAAKAEGVVKEPSVAAAVGGGLRHGTMQAAGNEVTAEHSARNRRMRMSPAASAARSVQSPLSDGRANVRPDVPRPGACNEAVAALGLCSLNSTGGSK